MFVRIEGDASYRVERKRTADGKKWKFMVSDNITYRYVDDREFHNKEDMEKAALEWVRNHKQGKTKP